MKKKSKNNTPVASTSNNYFSPLQTIADDNIDDDNTEVLVKAPVKVHVPPITILKVKIEEIHALCKAANVDKYSLRKISIGIKLFFESKTDFDTIVNILDGNFEFFTYATKTERPYEALLFGLDKHDPQLIKKTPACYGTQMLRRKVS